MKNEAKRARFVRVAERRTQRVLESLQMLGNCASPASYEYEPQQVEQIFATIDAKIELTRSRFEGRRQFSLSGEAEG